jgi:23S rRNA (uracil1939-C5)-methyltransferase
MPENLIAIKSLDMEGRGVGHLANQDGSVGKVIFVEGALPGETVGFASYRKKAKWEAAILLSVRRESSQRVTPQCIYFGVCGGCAMQHLDAAAQVAMKQRVLEDNFKHIGKLQPEMVLRPIQGPTWGYRYRARISVRSVLKKGVVLVGFHERKSRFITDMHSCDILPPHVSKLLVPLRGLISSLSITESVPQIELAIGEGSDGLVTALVLRIMAPLSAADEALLKAFADSHAVQWWLQDAGPDSAVQFYPLDRQLHYVLPEFGIRMPFKPTDFTQVNHHINQVLVSQALRHLDVQPGDRVADLFCGLGNFTLPLATQASEVVGIEGSAALVERASDNARTNGLKARTQFLNRNLFEISADEWIALGRFDRVLIDPPREGAIALCQCLADLHYAQRDRQFHEEKIIEQSYMPLKIVYVSCDPATLARDAAVLVGAGYLLKKAGVINMFPHTAHVESIAVFDRAAQT